MNEKIFCYVILLMQFGAGCSYAWFDDWRHSIFWFAATVITATVTL